MSDPTERETIGITPQVHGVGGMVSFQQGFSSALTRRGYKVADEFAKSDIAALLVIGGTRNLKGLRALKKRGVPIIQRLNGMNWLHRKLPTGIRHWLRAEYGNWILNTIRTKYADRVIYQSGFARDWWQRVRGVDRVSNTVVYNATDLNLFSPEGSQTRPSAGVQLLLVEGNLRGGYEQGLVSAVRLGERLRKIHRDPIQLKVVGSVSSQIQKSWSRKAQIPIEWVGLVDRGQIPAIDRNADMLFSGDINPACPNSVIEALACGLPVLSFDTGAIPELVDDSSGRVVPYGGDPWQLEDPDIPGLAKGALEILSAGEALRIGARKRATDMFGLERMVDGYLDQLLG